MEGLSMPISSAARTKAPGKKLDSFLAVEGRRILESHGWVALGIDKHPRLGTHLVL